MEGNGDCEGETGRHGTLVGGIFARKASGRDPELADSCDFEGKFICSLSELLSSPRCQDIVVQRYCGGVIGNLLALEIE